MSHEKRAVKIAEYMVKHNATVRKAAKHYGIPKSSVHTDITKVLKNVNLKLYNDTRKVLDNNFNEKHIRGGIATSKMYAKLRKQNKAN